MKQQKSLKLILINMLSDPDVIIEDYEIEKETEIMPDPYDNSVTGWKWMMKGLTGRKRIKLTIFKNDNTTTKTIAGTKKGTTTTSSKVLHPGQSGYTG